MHVAATETVLVINAITTGFEFKARSIVNYPGSIELNFGVNCVCIDSLQTAYSVMDALWSCIAIHNNSVVAIRRMILRCSFGHRHLLTSKHYFWVNIDRSAAINRTLTLRLEVALSSSASS